MKTSRWHRRLWGVIICTGCLLAGPCGLTTLQLRDFATSTLIRTTVTTLASVLEAATVQQATEQAAQQGA